MVTMQIRPSICAIITVRNEYQYLEVLLSHLAEWAIDAAIIDNGSMDNSR